MNHPIRCRCGVLLTLSEWLEGRQCTTCSDRASFVLAVIVSLTGAALMAAVLYWS